MKKAAVVVTLFGVLTLPAQPGARASSADCKNKCEQKAEACVKNAFGGASIGKCTSTRERCMASCPADSAPSPSPAGQGGPSAPPSPQPHDDAADPVEASETRGAQAVAQLLAAWRQQAEPPRATARRRARPPWTWGEFLATLCKLIPPNNQACTLGPPPPKPPPPPPPPLPPRWPLPSNMGLGSGTLSGDPWPPPPPKPGPCYVKDWVRVTYGPFLGGQLQALTQGNTTGTLKADLSAAQSWSPVVIENGTDHDVMVSGGCQIAYNTVVAARSTYTSTGGAVYTSATTRPDPNPYCEISVTWWTTNPARCATDAVPFSYVTPEEMGTGPGDPI